MKPASLHGRILVHSARARAHRSQPLANRPTAGGAWRMADGGWRMADGHRAWRVARGHAPRQPEPSAPWNIVPNVAPSPIRLRPATARRTAATRIGCGAGKAAERCPHWRRHRRHVAGCDRTRARPARNNARRCGSRRCSGPDHAATPHVSPRQGCAAKPPRSQDRPAAADPWQRTSSSRDPAPGDRVPDRRSRSDRHLGSDAAGVLVHAATSHKSHRSQ